MVEKQRILAEFQSPIGTNKTLYLDFHVYPVFEFQSPIGTNKTPRSPRQRSCFDLFQSPIGTNKTRFNCVWQ